MSERAVRGTLAEVYEDYRGDRSFDHLRTEHIVLVPGEGPSRPKLMVVGEAPGAMENTRKRPFVGASGVALRSLIEDTAGLSLASEVFITNVVKYRPAGNRTPNWKEVEDSVPYLRREYAALGRPPVIVAVGATAKSALAPAQIKNKGILRTAGKRYRLQSSPAAFWVMVHPSYALRNASFRPTMEEHWERLGSWFREEFGG